MGCGGGKGKVYEVDVPQPTDASAQGRGSGSSSQPAPEKPLAAAAPAPPGSVLEAPTTPRGRRGDDSLHRLREAAAADGSPAAPGALARKPGAPGQRGPKKPAVVKTAPEPPPEEPPLDVDAELDRALAQLTAEISSSARVVLPDVEVSPESREMISTWARWGRNSLRMREEIRIKELQHVKYPKQHRQRPPATPPLSPQSTPRATTPRQQSKDALNSTLGRMDSTPGRMSARGQHGEHVASRSARKGPRPSSIFEELVQDQRETMAETGARMRLTSTLGPGAAQANSTGTPGFGVATPGFAASGIQSRASASGTASVASSGVASPMAGGAISPWLLEAEALVNEDSGDEPPHIAAAWGLGPLLLEEIPEADVPEFKALKSPLKGFRGFGFDLPAPQQEQEEQELADDDDDELNQVSMFVESPQKSVPTRLPPPPEEPAPDIDDPVDDPVEPPERRRRQRTPGGSRAGSKRAGGQLAESNHGSPSSEDSSCRGLSFEAQYAEVLSTSSTAVGSQAYEYEVGEKVAYWSRSACSWLPAVVVERRSRRVYLIDKQGRGCHAKVRASELVSRAETDADPVLRGLQALGEGSASRPTSACSAKSARAGGGGGESPRFHTPQAPARASAPSPATLRQLTPRTGAAALQQMTPRTGKEALQQLTPRARGAALGQMTPRTRGRIVRDDFSDDSDDE